MFKKLICSLFLFAGSLCAQTVHTPTREGNNNWTGTQAYNPALNGVDILSSTRQTDTSPTGNFVNFKSLAGVTLFKIGIDGSITTSGAVAVQSLNGDLWIVPGTACPANTGFYSSMASAYAAASPGQTIHICGGWSETF